jgi:hypothetical protein
MKKILFVSFILLVGCSTPEIPLPEVLSKDNIFSVSESSVVNNQSLYFDLPSEGVYMLTLIHDDSNQVISRERFKGQNGENVKKIYTNTLPKGRLTLVLSDVNKNEIKKTKIIIN